MLDATSTIPDAANSHRRSGGNRDNLVAALAAAASCPCRLGQPAAARCQRIPSDREPDTPGEAREEADPAQRRPALANFGHRISDTTVARILRAHGIEPAPERKRETTWKTFLKAPWDVLVSVDFTTVDVSTRSGLVTYYLLFFMELATRRVHFAGMTAHPYEEWMLQVARNVTDAEGGFLRGKRYVLMDRDGKFSEAFRTTLEQAGVEAVRLPPRSPNPNPISRGSWVRLRQSVWIGWSSSGRDRCNRPQSLSLSAIRQNATTRGSRTG
jgi:hypothetical protein